MRWFAITLMIIPLLPWHNASAYPLYGSEDRGISRVNHARLAHEGIESGIKRIAGELLSLKQVDLRLLKFKDMELPEPDAAFTQQIVGLLGEDAPYYGISVLDLSDPRKPRYAEYNGDIKQNPGSVGKLMVAAGLFQALAEISPNDIKHREAILRDTLVTADDFIRWDEHHVSIWNPESPRLIRRPVKIGDEASLWVWLDWMMSASSNAAAAICMREAMLMKHFGRRYPVSLEESQRFFSSTSRKDLSSLYSRTFHDPLTQSGIDTDRLRQGSFFTSEGKKKVPGTTSHATPRELMKYLLLLEQGGIVDKFSSREIKRMIYVTERRIRYASSPELYDAAVYFKSGSLYACKPEEGFKCGKYKGNKMNYMNSVAIIESPAKNPQQYYLVTLTSNVLRKNSAVEHQTLATRIHQMIEEMHDVKPRKRKPGK